ncbi:MAG: hypothetical protein LBU24_04280 [Methanocalculaceae archaeon]|nr:hypothetical protein [Methanocalculaceae archaeon]
MKKPVIFLVLMLALGLYVPGIAALNIVTTVPNLRDVACGIGDDAVSGHVRCPLPQLPTSPVTRLTPCCSRTVNSSKQLFSSSVRVAVWTAPPSSA